MATMAGVSFLSVPRVSANLSSPDSTSGLKTSSWAPTTRTRMGMRITWSETRGRMVYVRAAPEGLSEKIATSIEKAQESCAEDPVSGECAAAWDEVEELSAASSHARDKAKDADPLETYCKDNPETDECRTYDN